MSELRFNVVESAFYKKAATVEVPEGRPCDYFGKYVKRLVVITFN